MKSNLISKVLAPSFLLFLSMCSFPAFAGGQSVGEMSGSPAVSQGMAGYRLDLQLPDGINELVPGLAIEYRQGSGNGPLGVGVQLTGLSVITRCSRNRNDDGIAGGISFDNTDVYCLDGKRLFLVSGSDGVNGSEYRLKDNLQTRITAVGQAVSGPDAWEVHTADGYITHYGIDTGALQAVNGHGLEWALSRQSDRFGNNISYHYATNKGFRYLDSIRYADTELSFHYSGRDDHLNAFRFGTEKRLEKKLDEIRITSGNQTLRSIHLDYNRVSLWGKEHTRLNSVKACGAMGECMPPHKFEWKTNPYAGLEPEQTTLFSLKEFKGYITGDINRDGMKDICYLTEGLQCALSTGSGNYSSASTWSTDFQGDDWEEVQNHTSLAFIDINDDTYPDVCAFNEKGFFCALNQEGKRFSKGRYWSRAFNIEQAVRLVDVNQDGVVDLCRIEADHVMCATNTKRGLSEEFQLLSEGFPLEKEYEFDTSISLKDAKELARAEVEPHNMPQSQIIDINQDGYFDLCGVKFDGNFYCVMGTAVDNEELAFSSTQKWAGNIPIGLGNNYKLRSAKEYEDDVKRVERLQRTLTLSDINSDGLPDLCYRKGDEYLCHQNTGTEMSDAVSRMKLNSSIWEITDGVGQIEASIMLDDKNGDGLADFCYIAGEKVYCAMGDGQRFDQPQEIATINADLEFIKDSMRYASNPVRKVFGIRTLLKTIQVNNAYGPFKQGVDVNGDGLAGDCYRSINGLSCLSYETEPLALLKSVTTGMGVTSEFVYGQTHDRNLFAPQDSLSSELVSLTPNLKVVKTLKTDNGIGGTHSTEYFYEGYYAHKEKGLLGFGSITVTDTENNSSSRSENGYHSDFTPYTRYRETRIDGYKVAESHYQYEEVTSVIGGKIQPRLTESRQSTWDTLGYLLSSEVTHYQDYDEPGFPETVIKTITDGNGDSFSERTDTRYQHDKSRWLLGKPTQIAVTKSNDSGSVTRTTVFEYDTETGALLKQTIEPGHPLSMVQTFGYNDRGFRTSENSVTSGQERASSTEYDDFARVVRHTNALGHSVSTRYHSLCGLPETVTDANGLITRFEYDDYCREVRKTLPDGNWVATVYQWSDGADAGLDQHGLVLGDRSHFMVTTQTSQGGTSTTYFDKLGREVRTEALNGDGKKVMVDKAYNQRGLLAGETTPYFEGLFEGDATYWLRTEYDNMGRAVHKIQSTEQDGDITAVTRYQGLSATTEGPGTFTRKETTNGLGQTTEITENGSSVLRFKYDAYGNLTETDANGLITNLSYDRLGNKTAMSDPAMGSWSYGYNGWGELIWQKDAKAQETSFSYDALGRKLTETRPDRTNRWQYDQAYKGALDSSAGDGAGRQYTYDELGRISSMTLNVDGQSYTTHYKYDEDGRLGRVLFPSGMNQDRDYDINGLLKRLSIPYSDIWDSQYLQLEAALKATSERIVELELKAYELEQNALFYIEESDRLRQAAEQLAAKHDRYEAQAAKLRASADSLFRSARINSSKAVGYKKKAQKFLRELGNVTFKYTKTQNGYAYYKYDKCVKSNHKGCKKRKYYTAAVPVWLVKMGRCPGGKFKHICKNGVRAQINATQTYNTLAAHFQAIADKQRAQARQKSSQARHYQNLANNAEARSRELLEQAKVNAALARQETDLLSDLTDELDDLVVAEAELKEILDQRLSDDTAEIIWLATSRDNFGRVSGELFGNGLLTRRDVDRSRGIVNRITTGMGDNYLRDIRYTYDSRSNVLSKAGHIRNQDEFYQYDEFDRLVSWSYSNNRTQAHTERDYGYDVYGNLTFKTGAGELDTNPNGQLRGDYRYDVNGNMLEGRGRTIRWNSFNKAEQITDNGSVISYRYGTERERIKQSEEGKVTYYISPEYQIELSTDESGNQVTTMRHRFIADDQPVAEHVKTLIGSEKQIDKTAYFHRDALGSADLITDPNGQVQIERGYTPFGELLASAELQATPLFTNMDMRGFTGHENVGGGSGLINMNARLYDPVIGRFLSADTFIPEPALSQSYNRYAYVLNNPLKYNDPTGHVWNFVIGAIIAITAMTFENPVIQTVGMIVGSVLMGMGTAAMFGTESVAAIAASGATTSFTTSLIATGDFGASLQAGVLGGLAAAATWGAAHGAGGQSPFGRALPLAHGVVQGGFNELRGGSFKQGFISGVVGKLGGGLVHNNFSDAQLVERTIGIVVVSGVAAAASGANGRDAVMRSAVSVITVYLYNEMGTHRRTINAKLMTVREGIDHSALWLEDDGTGNGPVLYDPAGQEYFPKGSDGMRHSDLFTGRFADPQKYIDNFGGDVDVISFQVTSSEAFAISNEFVVAPPLYCANNTAYALSRTARFKNIYSLYHPGILHRSLNNILKKEKN